MSRDFGRNHLVFTEGVSGSAVPVGMLDGTAKLFVNFNVSFFCIIIDIFVQGKYLICYM